MSITANNHEITGIVKSKHGPIAVGTKNMKKSFLYLDSVYMRKGKPETSTVKFVVWSFGDNASKIYNIFPGDEVKFTFSISGRVQDSKDKYGYPTLWCDLVIDSEVEILNTSQRKLYNNGVDAIDTEEELNDLPF
jgi:hypothetical protein